MVWCEPPISVLPADLSTAVQQCCDALAGALEESQARLWRADFRFEGLKLLPIVARLDAHLSTQDAAACVVFPDMGAAALARRDLDLPAQRCGTFADVCAGRCGGGAGLFIAVAPTAAEFDAFATFCKAVAAAPVVMLNGDLEDAAVGIGSVARERRRSFLSGWRVAYGLYPLDGAALRRAHPGPWELYREDNDGYRAVKGFDERPDAEAIGTALGRDQGTAGLAGLDGFLQALG